MTKKIDIDKIFTPQGTLGKVSKNPNLDFLMNIFNIPRVYGVSGFGTWSVGQHTVATAFLALYWSKHNKYTEEKRDKLVTMALLHDAHEAVTGDILPFFKTPEIKKSIDTIQHDILHAFSVREDQLLKEDLKLIDLMSFLYEIKQSTPTGIDISKKRLLKNMYDRQKKVVLQYAKSINIEQTKIKDFLKKMKL